MPNIAARLSSIGSALNSSRGSIPTVIEEDSLLPTPDTDSAPPTNVVPLNEGEKSYNGSETDSLRYVSEEGEDEEEAKMER